MPLHPRGRLLPGRAASSTLSNSELKVSKLIRVEWDGDLEMRMAYLARVAFEGRSLLHLLNCLLLRARGKWGRRDFLGDLGRCKKQSWFLSSQIEMVGD